MHLKSHLIPWNQNLCYCDLTVVYFYSNTDHYPQYLYTQPCYPYLSERPIIILNNEDQKSPCCTEKLRMVILVIYLFLVLLFSTLPLVPEISQSDVPRREKKRKKRTDRYIHEYFGEYFKFHLFPPAILYYEFEAIFFIAQSHDLAPSGAIRDLSATYYFHA